MERGQPPRYRGTPRVGVAPRNALPREGGKEGAAPMSAAEPCSPEPCCWVCSQGAILTHGPPTLPKAQEAFGYPASSSAPSSDRLLQVLQQTQILLFSRTSQRPSPPHIDPFPCHPREQLVAHKEEGDPLPGVVTALYPRGTDP